MIVVLDNARYHHATLLAAFLRRNAQQLRLLFLNSPRYLGTSRETGIRRLRAHNASRNSLCLTQQSWDIPERRGNW